jgi:enoyl-CoA hydratase/carnithine racemase
MMRELDAAILEARMDDSVHVIVLTGAGEKFFCAGATIGRLKDADPDFKYYLMAADLRIPRRDAGKIGRPEVGRGVLPATGGTQRLARIAGKARAMELMVTGRLMTMDEAAAIGLVTEVWGAEQVGSRPFLDAVVEYAKRFTPPAKASRAVGRIKRAVQSGPEAGLGEGLALERELQQLLFESDDAREGIAANLEKRAPKFRGK